MKNYGCNAQKNTTHKNTRIKTNVKMQHSKRYTCARYTCACGSTIAIASRKRHETSKRHKDNIPTDIKFTLSDLPKDLFNLVFSFCNEKTLLQCISKYPLLCIARKHPEYTIQCALACFARYNALQIAQYLCIKIKRQIKDEIVHKTYERHSNNLALWDAIKAATRHSHLTMVKYLYKVSRSLNVNHGYGYDYAMCQLHHSLDIAVVRKDMEMIEYLKSIGAQ